ADNAGGGKVPKHKTKRGKSKGDTEAKEESQVEDSEDKLLHEYQQQIVQEEQRTSKKTRVKGEEKSVISQSVTLNNDVGKKKKKKLRSVVTESDAGCVELSIWVDGDAFHILFSPLLVVKEESEAEPEVPQKPVFDDSLVLGVYIHRTDRLKTDLLISHPMVKIHVVDEITGQYVKKEDCHRPVSSFYEQESVDHILPIMTQPYDFKKNKSVIPEWQEQIIFNERFGYFVQHDKGPRVILFFEILDFVTMEEARANIDVDKHERGFRKIAWGFLKLVGANGVLNIDSKLRLQLFCPPHRAKRQSKTVEVVEWWRKYPRTKYASTLYITVKGIKLPEHVSYIRSMMALQEERGSTSYSELQNEVTKRSLTQPLDSKPPAVQHLKRVLLLQICRIPNKPMLAFRGGQMGCFTVLFSHAGIILAAACADKDAFPVVVYEIPSGKVLAAFNGHLKIVYDLCWSRDDRSLLSASSDGTVREWNVERLQATAQKVLPHPSFVYCARYHPTAQNLVITGGYDSLIRVWRLDVDDVNGQLLQEFEGHSSFVNAVCFDSEGIYFCCSFRVQELILFILGIPINLLQLHPNGRCLLIHAKDSVLRMMDLRILAVKKYTGAINYRERIYSTFTPCGNFIFSGSEDGMAYVWNTDTGDQVAVYSELCYPTALHGVSFHPHENMVAFCAFGQSQPVHVYLYDRKASADTKTVRNTPEPLALQDTSVSAAVDQFAQATRLALKMQCVKEQLDSVLVNACCVFIFNCTVVSLYDYKANRSDELTVCCGDVIQVLYKDNENWWFGRLENGQQGYFLASYVEDQSKENPIRPSMMTSNHSSLNTQKTKQKYRKNTEFRLISHRE
uniref:Abelson helper integration site 1 n=1 Tax=Amphilophus citrinellus TaxID=61819 RepID=A0A3Q0SS79_AMPCI